MRYKLLGKSGLRVSELCLGTMTFGEDWGWGAPQDTSRQIFDAFVEAGGNFIDTANLYTNGSSEKIVGEFIGAERDRFVLATKYSLTGQWQGENNPNGSGNHRKNMMRSIEGSLKRLNTDYVDMLWLHAWDFTTPVEEVMRAFDDLVRQGKVMYIGISDTPAWIVSQANTLAQAHGWAQFIALQIEYSLIERTPERDLLPMANAFNLAVTPWSPLAGGVLSGKYSTQSNGNDKSTSRGQEIPERSLKIAQTVGEIAQELERSSAQIALAWIRAQSPQMIPILGATKLEQLQDNLKCLEVKLSPEHLQRLDRASQIELGFPHDFLSSEMVRGNLFGSTYDSMDLPSQPLAIG
ncbi:aldo/keto reductase [Chamaesiphon polymorphus]|uniref:Aldo/keto reductase n=1 Tax=Chamaesiphon polymorphus CCALA 037 TaxID=2107692 RepID=A0A2T1G8L2_9CYAN|nr:aldo/keto reductase [Chamaesiphon polymorphus]PSB53520.1 aldo/keto reductase [Chamaesiphon polymorphus CCALA 037]